MARVLATKLEIVRCLNQLPKSDVNYPLEWKINTTENEYLDTRLQLMLEVDIRTGDGTALTLEIVEQDDPDSKTVPKAKVEIMRQSNVGPINNLLLSQFREYEFLINGQPYRTQNNCYSYWSFMKTLLTFNSVAKRSLLETQGWNLDTLDPNCTNATLPLNPGYYKRSSYYKSSAKVVLFGPLLTDLYDCGSPLFSKSEYIIRLFRQPHSFSLISPGDGANFIINIMKADLYVTKLAMSASLPRSINFIQSDVRILSIPAQVRNVDNEVYQGELPRRIIILQVSSDSYNGTYSKNPFNLEHFKATNITVLVNGNAHPVENNMLTLNPENHVNAYHIAYNQLYGLGIQDAMVDLTANDFHKGTFFWPINHDATEKTGIMRLQIDYESPLPSAVTILVLGDFERRLDKDNTGKITVT